MILALLAAAWLLPGIPLAAVLLLAPRAQACRPIVVDGKVVGIACGLPRAKPCSVPGCSERSVALCDWKLKGARRKTCSAPLCAGHTTKPAEGKDLCPAHADAWREWKAARGHHAG